ncbi:hypothetical protein KP22_19930 [Pectobacterium betavasculorum]|uniref:HTH luxR-type domain-containing protein n=1 Tax=Pectobacterium betavasculorum TaxID=55207 RepID=A0A093RRR3_9GAMM|nr:LuxR C-terminal-related transcriptional regulator [Pectobacterium betavasculorum]KFX00496.1 hypothetical protein KP22_19930 [Pectobacterium betavasculorum]
MSEVNGKIRLINNDYVDKVILIYDNNIYFHKSASSFLHNRCGSEFIVNAVSDEKDLFYQIAINENIDTIFIAYHPVWMNTLHSIYKLKKFYPEIRTVVLLDDPHFPSVVLMRCFEIGIILSKKDDLECLNSVLDLMPCDYYLSPSFLMNANDKNMDRIIRIEKMKRFLTPMERFILAEIFGEKSTSIIAQERGCSVKTIYQHKKNALVKMGFKSLVEIIYLRKGNVFPNETRNQIHVH